MTESDEFGRLVFAAGDADVRRAVSFVIRIEKDCERSGEYFSQAALFADAVENEV